MVRWRNHSGFSDTLRNQAKRMRKAPTPAEAELWKHLRNQQRGAKFRRQRLLDRFIADFYCSEACLVIEIDGAIHAERREEDAVRQSHLERLGLRVLRFSNDDVLHQLREVLQTIDRVTRSEVERIAASGIHPGPIRHSRSPSRR